MEGKSVLLTLRSRGRLEADSLEGMKAHGRKGECIGFHVVHKLGEHARDKCFS